MLTSTSRRYSMLNPRKLSTARYCLTTAIIAKHSRRPPIMICALRKILLLTRMEIKPEYRGHGAGLVAIRALIDVFGRGCGLVVCKPFPLQYKDEVAEADRKEFEKALEKLRKYWSRLGFQRVAETDLYALSLAEEK